MTEMLVCWLLGIVAMSIWYLEMDDTDVSHPGDVAILASIMFWPIWLIVRLLNLAGDWLAEQESR